MSWTVLQLIISPTEFPTGNMTKIIKTRYRYVTTDDQSTQYAYMKKRLLTNLIQGPCKDWGLHKDFCSPILHIFTWALNCNKNV